MRKVTVILLIVLVGCSRTPPGDLQTDQYLVGAYYNFGFPGDFQQGFLRAMLDPPQVPALGLYDSTNIAVAEQHIAWAAPRGIDFFAVDWWPNRPEQNATLANGFLKARNIGDIRFCISFESWDLGFNRDSGATVFTDQVRTQFVADVTALGEQFFSHPSYLRVGGRPVLILRQTSTFTGNFAAALHDARRELKRRGYDVFIIGDEISWSATPAVKRMLCLDAITVYSMFDGTNPEHAGYAAQSGFVDDVAAAYAACVEAGSRRIYFVPGVMPGYNDRGARRGLYHGVLPRQWDADDREGSLLAHAFDKLALRFADPRLNMILVTSWNDWSEDTAIEPLVGSPSTRHDQSREKDFFTQGYSYAGHGLAYLDTIRDRVVAMSGRVVYPDGSPAPGVRVRASIEGRIVASGLSLSDGSFRLSRLHLPPGLYEVGLDDGARVTVEVLPRATATGVVFSARSPST